MNVNDVIDPNLLEHFLETEFKKRNLNVTYEYAIYDCNSQKMIHGNLIKYDSIPPVQKSVNSCDSASCSVEEIMYEKQLGSTKTKIDKKKKDCNLPTCEKFTYYFGVHFPDRSQFYNSRLLTWYFF